MRGGWPVATECKVLIDLNPQKNRLERLCAVLGGHGCGWNGGLRAAGDRILYFGLTSADGRMKPGAAVL